MTDLEKNVIEMYNSGFTYREIMDKLNVTRSFVRYRVSEDFKEVSLRREAKKKSNKEFGDIVEKILPYCNSYNNLCNKLGLKGTQGYYQKVQRVINERNLDTSHFGTIVTNNKVREISDEEWFALRTNRQGARTLKRLIEHGYKEWKCEKCQKDWYDGEQIPLEVHHSNFDHYDNRIDNLMLLCPICHCRVHKENKGKTRVDHLKRITNKCLTKDEQQNLNKTIYCVVCGKPISKTAKYYCSHKCAIKNRTNKLTEEEIINAFKEKNSFLGAGKLLGLTDNGLKKTCKRLGILDKIEKMRK